MSSRTSKVCRRIAMAVIPICVALPVGPASAGRLVATGHDADSHCGGREVPVAGCHFFRVAVDYARGGAPDATKPVLVLDRASLDVVGSLDRSYSASRPVPRVVVDPRSSRFASMPITTDLYSAVIVASSRGNEKDLKPQDLNEFNSTPDSDAILKRARDLRAFFNAGGGIFVNAGNSHGDDPGDPYYAFLPITVQGRKVTPPFALTDLGRSLGFVDAGTGKQDDVTSDINCCATHNAFDPPSAQSALRVAETDKAGRVVTLVADAQSFESLKEPQVTPAVKQQVASGLRSTKGCIASNRVRLRLKRPAGLHFSRALVYVNGKRVSVSVKGKRFKTLRGSRVSKTFSVTLRRSGSTRVKIVVTTSGKRKFTIKRTYRRCA